MTHKRTIYPWPEGTPDQIKGDLTVVARKPVKPLVIFGEAKENPLEPLLNPRHPEWMEANALMYEISRVDPFKK